MKIVGVTACPTGIAHTYMAQAALERECERRGYEFKFETQGSIGVENHLSQQDVDSADVVILAVDIIIEEEERFEKKLVLSVESGRVIARSAEVIDQAVALTGAGR